MKKIIAFIIDLVGSFIIFGYLTAFIFGQTTGSGFNLSGLPAFIALALIIAYFVVMNKFMGGTLGQRIMGLKGGSNNSPQNPPAA